MLISWCAQQTSHTSFHHLLRSGDDELNHRITHHSTAHTILTPSGNDHHSFAGPRAMVTALRCGRAGLESGARHRHHGRQSKRAAQETPQKLESIEASLTALSVCG